MKNLEISQLRALDAIVRSGGVGRAAEVLNLTQGAVSIQIKRLEEKTGHKLLKKNGRTVALTPSGDVLWRYAKQILELNDRAVDHMRSGDLSQTLNIGLPPDIAYPCLTQVFSLFAEQFPEVKLRPHFGTSAQLLQKFNDNELDFFVSIEVNAPGREIFRVPVRWYFSGDQAVATRRPLPIVLGENPSARRMISKVLDEHGVSHHYLPSAADLLASAAIVNAGEAVTVMVDRPTGHENFRKVPCGLLPELPEHGIYILHIDSGDEIFDQLSQIVTDVVRGYFEPAFPEERFEPKASEQGAPFGFV